MGNPPWACLRKKDLGWDRGVESKKVVQHVYLVGAKSIYRVAEKDKEYLRDEEEKNQNTACGASCWRRGSLHPNASQVFGYAEENKFADSLHITGWVDDPMSYVELFDVACLLSRWEGFGLALPEYMMAGKPIVASRVDAIPNIIRNGENGLLVEVDDATGASEAVLQIYRDRSLKDKLVSKGVEDVHNRFDAQRVSEEHGILFENMWKVETI